MQSVVAFGLVCLFFLFGLSGLSGLTGLSGVMGGGVVTKIFDQFTGADTTAISAHAIAPTNTPGTSWTDLEAGITLSSNRAFDNTGSLHSATIDPAVSTCTITLIAHPQSGGSGFIQVLFRSQDINNQWRYIIDPGAGGGFTSGLQDVNAGVVTTRASDASALAYDTDLPAKLVQSGSAISGTVNAKTVSFSSAFLQAQTKQGIRMYRSQVDDYKVTVP